METDTIKTIEHGNSGVIHGLSYTTKSRFDRVYTFCGFDFIINPSLFEEVNVENACLDNITCDRCKYTAEYRKIKNES